MVSRILPFLALCLVIQVFPPSTEAAISSSAPHTQRVPLFSTTFNGRADSSTVRHSEAKEVEALKSSSRINNGCRKAVKSGRNLHLSVLILQQFSNHGTNSTCRIEHHRSRIRQSLGPLFSSLLF